MLDIVGIGALNTDFTVTSEKMKILPPVAAKTAIESFEFGAERLVDESKIEEILSLLGRDSFRAALGGSAFNTICAMAELAQASGRALQEWPEEAAEASVSGPLWMSCQWTGPGWETAAEIKADCA